MKNILLIGAGRSTSALAQYLNGLVDALKLSVTVVDRDKGFCDQRVAQIKNAQAKYFDVFDKRLILPEIEKTHLVISMLPASLHFPIIKLCVDNNTDVLTASYVSEEVRFLDAEAKSKNVKIFMECGLDPGIDHMSAMEEIDLIHEQGGQILSFKSFTGGLVAPDSDDNPWGYKLSWNPRNVVLAGNGITQFIRNNRKKYIPYTNLFERTDTICVDGYGGFEGYPNRDSLSYQELYGLQSTPTVIRGTLRRPGFCSAWSKIVKLGLTDDSCEIDGVSEMSFRDFTNSFLPYSEELSVEDKFRNRFALDLDSSEYKMVEWLGLFSRDKIGLSKGTAAQVLQVLLMDKWRLSETDKDMVVMQHQFEFLIEGKVQKKICSLVIEGEDKVHTAMAKTVGLPLGIMARQILEGKLGEEKGVIVPLKKSLYKPVLKELENYGIKFEKSIV